MNLINPILAFGTLAFTIPLVIHLFFRSRFKTLDWGAMYLLESVIRINRRRMQLTNLLLLLLRCLIPILLACCLARPVWNGFRTLSGDAPKTLVIAIDDSRSMSVAPTELPPRIEYAKAEVRKVLSGLSRRDEVILLRSSRLGGVAAKMGVSQALEKLRRIDARGNPVPIGKLIEAAEVATQDATHPRRHVLVVSDFQSGSVDNPSIETARQLAAKAEANAAAGTGAIPGDQTAGHIVFDFLDVSPDWSELKNVSVDEVKVHSPVVVQNRSSAYSATIRNSSSIPANDLRLTWSIDGKPLDPRVISVNAKSSTTNRLTFSIDTPGTHEIKATIDRSDVLADDNSRSVAVEVIEEINVALIDGAPSKQPLQGQADFLAIALSPFAFGGDDRPDPVRASVVREQRLDATLQENDVRVMMLAGVGRLSQSTKQSIAEFVIDGGALVVFDGPSVKPSLYNEPWGKPPQQLSFPVELGDVVGQDDDSQDAKAMYAIDAPTRLYAPWQMLSSQDQNPLSDVSLSAFREFKLRQSPQQDQGGPIVLLKTGDAQPLAVTSSAGKGTVIQFAFSAGDRWTNLPLRPVFLPLIQQMVLDLADSRDNAMVEVGNPIVIQPSQWPDFQSEPTKQSRTTFVARTPRGEVRLNPPEQDQPLHFTATHDPGVYRLTRRMIDQNETPLEETSILRVAAVSPDESVLEGTTSSRLNQFAGTLQAQVFQEAVTLQAADHDRSFGTEIWRWLFALLLIALVVELWLQQNLIARRRNPGGAS